MQQLASRLERRPLAARGNDGREPDPRALGLGAEIGDAREIDLAAPEVARERLAWWQGGLGERSVPLRPRGRLAVGEIDRIDDRAALASVNPPGEAGGTAGP